jgi:archaellin
VRFPWLNDVSAAVTIDSTGLLQFRSNATMKQTLQGNNLNRKRDYGYGVIEKREFSSEEWSCVLKRE